MTIYEWRASAANGAGGGGVYKVLLNFISKRGGRRGPGRLFFHFSFGAAGRDRKPDRLARRPILQCNIFLNSRGRARGM